MIGQLNSLLPPIRPHTSLFYRQTFHWHFLSSSLHFSPTSQRDRERERGARGARAQPASPPPPFTRPLSTPLLPAHACTSSLWCWLDADRRISSSFLSLCSFPPFLSVPPPLSLSLLLLFFPTSEASLLLPPLFYPFHTTRMWHSVALLLSGFSALIHGEPAFMSLSVCLSLCFQGIGLQQHFRGIRALGSTLLMLDLRSMQWNKNSRK